MEPMSSFKVGSWAPLNCAAHANDRRTIKRLLSAGADVNSTDEYGWTPYILAQAYGHKGSAQCLSMTDSTVRDRGETLALPPTGFTDDWKQSGISFYDW
ncbi:hypothetical protein FQN54_001933 [Arachnomyces sp. PD_36]|nr:hypothetical protein FQN54_001933 [Arachnomyces sp. PD_36]